MNKVLFVGNAQLKSNLNRTGRKVKNVAKVCSVSVSTFFVSYSGNWAIVEVQEEERNVLKVAG